MHVALAATPGERRRASEAGDAAQLSEEEQVVVEGVTGGEVPFSTSLESTRPHGCLP